MLSYERAGEILDAAVDALPEGLYEDLNGGVNLLRESRRSGDGRYIMGLYHNNSMGRYVEIFYGSFAAVYPDASDESVEEELVKTLHHELTHHVESKAGDRTLERWDEEQTRLWLEGAEDDAPLKAERLLFVSDSEELAREAYTQFTELSRGIEPPFHCGWTTTAELRREYAEGFDAVLCMTLAEAEALEERFPALDERFLCLGEKDILPPLRHARRQLRREAKLLLEELLESREAET